ncbi:hypothetical protein P3W85_34185 [Cupriavidus basilensis]|uniref:PIN domain-containing protein n=1 Tax=Cupriavidus basilensis TaxID=68895 RepID=A0ABT6AZA1_9BURK|nr:hypothetical protein [Cupriavidus basilensis]MDF3837946.1 hypothetical protein [Cupriavidus basilensis]
MSEGKARTAKVFVDSNVVLCLLSEDAAKADRSEGLMRLKPTIPCGAICQPGCVRLLQAGCAAQWP